MLSKVMEGIFDMVLATKAYFDPLINRFIAGRRFTVTPENLSRIIESAMADSRPLVPAKKLLRRRSRR
jgi:hypothetical protein